MSGELVGLALAAIDHLDTPAWIVEAGSGRIVAANTVAADTVAEAGSADGDVGRPIGELLEPPLDDERWAAVCGGIDGPRSELLSSHLRTGAGAEPVRLWLSRHDHGGTPVVLAVARPVEADATPTAGPGDLADVTSVLDQGVALVDGTGRITSVNAAFCRMVGRSEQQLLDRTVHDPPWDLMLEDGTTPDPGTTPPVTALRTARSTSGPTLTPRHVRGDRPWCSMSAHPLPLCGSGAPTGAVVVLRDETPDRRTAAALDRLAGSDPLTGLASRSRIVQVVGSLMQDVAAASSGVRVGVLHVDVDGFRAINESFGPAVGDTILVQVAGRLRDLADRGVELGRIGVDEFLVVLRADGASLAFDSRLRRLAEEVQRRLSEPFRVDDLSVRVTVSVGVARAPGDAQSADALLLAADRAVAASRIDLRHPVEFHPSGGAHHVHRGMAVEPELRTAVANHDVDVHYQPLLDLRTGALAAAEALLRWHHPLRGPIPPSVFIPAAESNGSIVAIGDLVLSTVASDVRRWSDAGLLPPEARIAVNVSATEFEHPQYVERLSRVLAEAGVPPERIELEITESLLVQDLRAAARRLAELDQLGFLIALDDFGTGYSSLSYLHSLPLHALKIDRQFVNDLRDGRSGTITRTIVSMAHNLGILAVAEGVETEAQRAFLVDAGCDLVQGFLHAPPLPRGAFERRLRDDCDARPAQPNVGVGAS